MSAAAVNRIESRRRSNDCAIWCLSVYLGIPYERVYAAVAQRIKTRGDDGLTTAQIKRVAQVLGVRLRVQGNPDLSDDYGILLLDDHVVVLRNGLVFDTDATVWDVDVWLKHHGYTCLGLLVVA